MTSKEAVEKLHHHCQTAYDHGEISWLGYHLSMFIGTLKISWGIANREIETEEDN